MKILINQLQHFLKWGLYYAAPIYIIALWGF